MAQRLIVPLAMVLLVNTIMVSSALAGFGITPPYVRNTSLTRNSVYEQQILMVRSDPTEPLKATVSVDAPEIADWITILEGNTIQLPAGQQKVPLTVRVQVPDDAEFKTYNGDIRIKTGAADDQVQAGAVSISLGAQIDMELTVIDKEIFDFRVRKIGLPDLNEGHKVGWLYFPGKIRFNMSIENTGNVDVAPTQVQFKIYDPSGTLLLEETEHTNRIDKVPPFGTSDVTAELPTKLPSGTYVARYAIYNGDDIKQEGEITMSILPYGTLQLAGYGFLGLSLPHKISVMLPVITLIVLVGLAISVGRNRRRA